VRFRTYIESPTYIHLANLEDAFSSALSPAGDSTPYGQRPSRECTGWNGLVLRSEKISGRAIKIVKNTVGGDGTFGYAGTPSNIAVVAEQTTTCTITNTKV
jgi:lipoate-protein ligase A